MQFHRVFRLKAAQSASHRRSILFSQNCGTGETRPKWGQTTSLPAVIEPSWEVALLPQILVFQPIWFHLINNSSTWKVQTSNKLFTAIQRDSHPRTLMWKTAGINYACCITVCFFVPIPTLYWCVLNFEYWCGMSEMQYIIVNKNISAMKKQGIHLEPLPMHIWLETKISIEWSSFFNHFNNLWVWKLIMLNSMLAFEINIKYSSLYI